MTFSPRHQFLFICLIQYLRVSSSRDWMDAINPATLQNDGMPRVPSPSRNKTADEYLSKIQGSNTIISSHMTAANEIEIEMHGSITTLFEEVDPFRVTGAPSSAPSYSPSITPSSAPSSQPTDSPSNSPTQSASPTETPTYKPTQNPTSAPTFTIAQVPPNPNPGYFNYDITSNYGPIKWGKNIKEIERTDPGYFWHTFDLGDDSVVNDCGSGKKQSPIDVCVKPRDSCTETHEMRPKVSFSWKRSRRTCVSDLHLYFVCIFAHDVYLILCCIILYTYAVG